MIATLVLTVLRVLATLPLTVVVVAFADRYLPGRLHALGLHGPPQGTTTGPDQARGRRTVGQLSSGRARGSGSA